MYKIENRPSGYILTFAGAINAEEMQKWANESEQILSSESRETFGVIVDMKDLLPLDNETKGIMIKGQQLYKEKGMLRSAVILNSPEITLQFKTIAFQSGIYSTERYIDASSNPKPIESAISWVKEAIDPDK